MSTISHTIQNAVRRHQAGHLDQAEQLYRGVLAERPGHPDALHLLGVIAYQRGDHEAAIDLIQQSLAIAPNDSGAHNNLGNALQAVQQHARAELHHRRAVELEPEAADAHNNLGNALKGQGRLKQAVASFQRALQLKPDYAAAHNNLGSTYQEMGQLTGAVNCYRQALHHDPKYVGAHSNLGSALHALTQIDPSIAHFRLALQHTPNLPQAHLGLGKVLLDKGEFEQAIGCLQQAIRIQPGCPGAFHELSHLARQRRYRFDETELATMRDALASERLNPDESALLHFALAAVLDQQHAYDEAFAHFDKGSRLRRTFLRQRNIQADHEKYLDLVDEIVATFDDDYFQRVRPFGLESELPVFVVGMPRSGTTLVEQILASHPRVFGAGELRGIANLANDLPAYLESSQAYPQCLAELDRAAVRAVAEKHLAHLATLGGDALRVVDKMPLNYNHLGLIATLFPQARVIHCRRDPRDVCLSCYMQYEIPFSLEGAAFCYRQYSRLMDHWGRVLPISLLDIDYEQIVADLPTAARQLLEFCGLPWNDQCLSFHDSERTVQTPSKVQVRQPIYASSVGRWKNYRAHLKSLCASLGISNDDNDQRPPME